jgi:hypothetical protein
MKPFAMGGMLQCGLTARVLRAEHRVTLLPKTAVCPDVMPRCPEMAGSKVIFAKRTHLRIKLNPT